MNSSPSGAQVSQLAELLGRLNSPNNQIREEAELTLNNSFAGGVDNQAQLLLSMAQLAVSGEPDSRSFAAVLLRRYSIKISTEVSTRGMELALERVIDSLPQPVIAQLRSMLLAGLLSEQTRDTRLKISDVVAEMARATDWPDLVQALFTNVHNPEETVREAVFRILYTTPEIIARDVALIDQCPALLNAGFTDSSEHVQVSATEAFGSFFDKLPRDQWVKFKGLLPDLLRVMEPLRQKHQATQLSAVLQNLTSLAGIAPKMFQPVFGEVVDFALTVAGDSDTDEDTRLSAFEFVTTFADQAPNMCLHDPNYVEKMVVQCLKMLVELDPSDENTAEWNNEDDYDLQEEQEQIHGMAKDALDRMALRIDSEAMIKPLFAYIPKMLESPDWRERHGALMALSSVAEGCRDIMLNELGNILDMVLPHLQDPHSRVQWAACNALGQMSTDFADILQRRYGSRVLPALISKLNNQSTYRVQVHAAAAIFNFSESAKKETLDPYLDDLLTGLMLLLQSPKRYIQEQALTTISIVAGSAQTKFVKYYDVLMPQLINVLKSNTGSEYALLKARSIECCTLIAVAVGKEKFQPQFQEVVNIFVHIQDTTSEEDPCQVYLVQAWARICKVMGHEFLPYLSKVLPPVIKVAKSEADYQILDEQDATYYYNRPGWDVHKAYGQYIGVNYSGFEDKANCIERLGGYASELGADFYPYVPGIVQEIAIPSLSFFYHEESRINACQLIPHLIASAQLAAARDRNDDPAAKYDERVIKIWDETILKMLDLFSKEETVSMMAEMYTTMYQCISLIGPQSVPPPLAQNIIRAVKASTHDLNTRMMAREARGYNDDFVEGGEDEEEAEEMDETLIDSINKLIHVLFKTLRQDFLPSFEAFVPTLQGFLEQDNERLEMALAIVDDLIEFTGPASFKYVNIFGGVITRSLTDENPRIRQAALYGIGVAAQHGGEQYRQAVLMAVETMFQICNDPRARDEINLAATENACTAIAKVLRYHGPAFGDQLDMALTAWVKTLPIIEDIEVAPFAYLFLADLMDKKHSAVTSQIGHVFHSVAQALVYNSIGGKTAGRVIEATRNLLAAIPQDQMMQLFHQLPAEDQPTISALFR